jgi:hypothetical protein
MTSNFNDNLNDYEAARIETMYVSEVIDVPFHEAAAALATLAGHTITVGGDRLDIGEQDGDDGPAPYQRVTADLHPRGILPRSIHVDLALSPWSDDRTEVGMAPRGRHFPLLSSGTTERYLRSARATTEELARALAHAGDRAAAWAERKSA